MRLISGKFSIVMSLRTEEDLEVMTAFDESDEEYGNIMQGVPAGMYQTSGGCSLC